MKEDNKGFLDNTYKIILLFYGYLYAYNSFFIYIKSKYLELNLFQFMSLEKLLFSPINSIFPSLLIGFLLSVYFYLVKINKVNTHIIVKADIIQNILIGISFLIYAIMFIMQVIDFDGNYELYLNGNNKFFLNYTLFAIVIILIIISNKNFDMPLFIKINGVIILLTFALAFWYAVFDAYSITHNNSKDALIVDQETSNINVFKNITFRYVGLYNDLLILYSVENKKYTYYKLNTGDHFSLKKHLN